jgi:hypothetical protein
MKTFRLTAAAVATAFALLLLGGAGTAAAQEPLAFGKKVPVTGEAKNGRQFEGTFTIQRFVRRAGTAWAVGTLRGELGNRRVVKRGVRMPVTAAEEGTGSTSAQPPLPIPTPGACTILRLTLGPIDLNLLGLRVATNEIRLLVEAVPGAGNLLGNLLCAITNLLNPPALSGSPLGQLVQILNALLALAPRTATALPA